MFSKAIISPYFTAQQSSHSITTEANPARCTGTVVHLAIANTYAWHPEVLLPLGKPQLHENLTHPLDHKWDK
jgi:hypothetical protein